MGSARISSLPVDVVNRIAAGEIVTSPSNVVKELLENSIDAGSTEITVTIERGGYQRINIADDGCGIPRDDMKIACRRHTTSKLRAYKDLPLVSTFGFRGEALYSISCVAHMKITTKTDDGDVAWSASYADGEVVGEIAMVAGNRGTIIDAADLFYNYQIRLKSVKPVAETRIINDIVAKYAAIHPAVRFAVFSDRKETVRTFGHANIPGVLNRLFGFETKLFVELDMGLPGNVNVLMFLNRPGQSSSKKVHALFVNGRLVENDNLRKTLDDVYGSMTLGFAFILLSMPHELVDVNIHPAKKVVQFIGEKDVIEAIRQRVSDEITKKDPRVVPTKNNTKKVSEPAHVNNQSIFEAFSVEKRGLVAAPVERTHLDSTENRSDAVRTVDVCGEHTRELKGSDTLIANSEPGIQAIAIREETAPVQCADAPTRQEENGAKCSRGGPRNDVHGQRKICDAFASGEMCMTDKCMEPKQPDHIIDECMAVVLDVPVGRVALSAAVEEREIPVEEVITERQLERPEYPLFNFSSATFGTNMSKRKERPLEKVIEMPDVGNSIISNLPVHHEKAAVPPPANKTKPAKDRVDVFSELRFEPTKRTKARGVIGSVTIEKMLETAADEQFVMREVTLESILALRAAVNDDVDADMSRLFSEMRFVGFTRLKGIIGSWNGSLYVCSLFGILRDFMSQKLLELFANFRPMIVNIKISDCFPDDPDLASSVSYILTQYSVMLKDYFCISVENDVIVSLPSVITGYRPPLAAVPLMLQHLTTSVDWNEEIKCFSCLINELASLYATLPESCSPQEEYRLQRELSTVILPIVQSDAYLPSIHLKLDRSVAVIPDFQM